jgi:hypothetical protein
MNVERLMDLLDAWSRWMRSDDHGLGYPKKSPFLQSGGESTEGVFEDMLDAMDLKQVITIDAIIESLPQDQKKALFARFLKSRKPMYYEKNLEMAIDNLLTIASRRIGD